MVFIPGISKRLERRKGGGGGGRGGGGGGGRGSSGGSSGGRGGSISSGGGQKSTSNTAFGGGRSTAIPQGQLFSGRQQGGGNRNQIYGGRSYGSGYPGVSTLGVAGLGFPFYFWPVVWGSATLGGTALYLHSAHEYGESNNSSRPGGAMSTAAFPSSSVTNSTFRLLADSSTVGSLVTDIVNSCGSSISNGSSITATTYNDSGPPRPEQAVQYYRASSVVLSLDTYNNTAVFTNDTNAPNSPLPNNIDSTLLSCLNTTIGQNAPLVDGALGLQLSSPSSIGLFVLVWIISKLSSQV